MPKKIDLTGQRFGRLVVVADSGIRKHGSGIVWECECDCGNHTKVSSPALRNGTTRSCGCLRKENSKIMIYETPYHDSKHNIVGRRYGRLLVVSETAERFEGNKYWKCQCDCGVVKNVLGLSLKNKSTVSCGCYGSDIHKESINHAHVWSQENDLKEGTKLTSLNNKLSSANTSGHKGVTWSKDKKRWKAQIKIQGRNIYLGVYHNKQDAIDARKAAEEKYFKPILEKYGKRSK